MAGYFTLTREGETTPANLNDVDADFCAILGREVDPKEYVVGWFDTIGMMLAFGRDMPYIREACLGYYYEKELLLICDAIEANYSTNNWGGR